MAGFFYTRLFWPSNSRVRHLSFLDLHAQHFKMHQAESAELQGQLAQYNEDEAKKELMAENKEDYDVEEAKNQVADDGREPVREPKDDEAQPNVRRTVKAV